MSILKSNSFSQPKKQINLAGFDLVYFQESKVYFGVAFNEMIPYALNSDTGQLYQPELNKLVSLTPSDFARMVESPGVICPSEDYDDVDLPSFDFYTSNLHVDYFTTDFNGSIMESPASVVNSSLATINARRFYNYMSRKTDSIGYKFCSESYGSLGYKCFDTFSFNLKGSASTEDVQLCLIYSDVDRFAGNKIQLGLLIDSKVYACDLEGAWHLAFNLPLSDMLNGFESVESFTKNLKSVRSFLLDLSTKYECESLLKFFDVQITANSPTSGDDSSATSPVVTVSQDANVFLAKMFTTLNSHVEAKASELGLSFNVASKILADYVTHKSSHEQLAEKFNVSVVDVESLVNESFADVNLADYFVVSLSFK